MSIPNGEFDYNPHPAGVSQGIPDGDMRMNGPVTDPLTGEVFGAQTDFRSDSAGSGNIPQRDVGTSVQLDSVKARLRPDNPYTRLSEAIQLAQQSAGTEVHRDGYSPDDHDEDSITFSSSVPRHAVAAAGHDAGEDPAHEIGNHGETHGHAAGDKGHGADAAAHGHDKHTISGHSFFRPMEGIHDENTPVNVPVSTRSYSTAPPGVSDWHVTYNHPVYAIKNLYNWITGKKERIAIGYSYRGTVAHPNKPKKPLEKALTQQDLLDILYFIGMFDAQEDRQTTQWEGLRRRRPSVPPDYVPHARRPEDSAFISPAEMAAYGVKIADVYLDPNFFSSPTYTGIPDAAGIHPSEAVSIPDSLISPPENRAGMQTGDTTTGVHPSGQADVSPVIAAGEDNVDDVVAYFDGLDAKGANRTPVEEADYALISQAYRLLEQRRASGKENTGEGRIDDANLDAAFCALIRGLMPYLHLPEERSYDGETPSAGTTPGLTLTRHSHGPRTPKTPQKT